MTQFPTIADIDYHWHTERREINGLRNTQLTINIQHQGLKTDYRWHSQSNHYLYIKLVDMESSAELTPWLNACEVITPIKPVDGTGCLVFGKSSTSSRVCNLPMNTPLNKRLMLYIHYGLPLNKSGVCITNLSVNYTTN